MDNRVEKCIVTWPNLIFYLKQTALTSTCLDCTEVQGSSTVSAIRHSLLSVALIFSIPFNCVFLGLQIIFLRGWFEFTLKLIFEITPKY